MNYIVLDLETTGLDITTDEPTQIALIAHDELGHSIEYSTLIKTSVPIDPVAQRLTGITPELISQLGRTPREVAVRYRDFVWQFAPVAVIGYNFINFDFPILQRMLALHAPGTFKHPPVLQVIDVMHLASIHFKTKKWLRLEEAAHRLGIEPDGKLHDALTDVRLTWLVFSALLDPHELFGSLRKWVGTPSTTRQRQATKGGIWKIPENAQLKDWKE